MKHAHLHKYICGKRERLSLALSPSPGRNSMNSSGLKAHIQRNDQLVSLGVLRAGSRSQLKCARFVHNNLMENTPCSLSPHCKNPRAVSVAHERRRANKLHVALGGPSRGIIAVLLPSAVSCSFCHPLPLCTIVVSFGGIGFRALLHNK